MEILKKTIPQLNNSLIYSFLKTKVIHLIFRTQTTKMGSLTYSTR